ncbi:50S ribosomal protein L17 [Patescibacteria group bacterium]|nr:50S ribosomal protein L17 [Patescibacteria group bacterium]MBU4023428.1 50S ribosomal protein L17 [Patescibacteria group bacterium]MBU4077991.1 50S ribosomal protein L17 [Patescibacteria group bacterium]
MKKQKKGRKFNRKRDQRRALMTSIARSLILKGRIETTEAKAKELSPFVEKKITKAKKGDMAAKRELLKDFSNRVVKKLMEEIAPIYKDRHGGYTRIIKTGIRKRDSSKMAIIEFLDLENKKTKEE